MYVRTRRIVNHGRSAILGLAILLVLFWSSWQLAAAWEDGHLNRDSNPNVDRATPCTDGMAGPYPCRNVDLLGHLSLADLGAGPETLANDIWGWTDPQSGREFALVGLTDGVAFVDVSQPENPRYLGTLPTHTTNSVWRDIKVYDNHAFIVADQPSQHGMQVFDLTQLPAVITPTTFTETAYYGGFGNGHNMFINEDTGYGYVVRTETCSGALHMLDLSSPANPTFAGCFDDDGVTSDTQCVVYNGPDMDYQGREICFTGSDDALTIGDVSDKSNPQQIARLTYNGMARAHQGWLTEDQSHFLLSDTFDESDFGHNTRTYLWNVSDLDSVLYMGFYEHPTTAVDHNVYIVGQYAYETNFRAGLRILDVGNIANGNLNEVAYFDVDPSSDSPVKSGAWSNYPWFESGILIVSDTEQGLFVLQPNLNDQPTGVSLSGFGAESTAVSSRIPLVLLVIAGLALLAAKRSFLARIWRQQTISTSKSIRRTGEFS